ncbi:MAG TPA: PspC domain-containing protein [Bryobacteraceae bacterium]|nr:PspC domain-containing protein [Bryobacteraceae bacterium]
MFCTRCGIELSDTANFCSACGTATPNAAASRGFERPSAGSRLTRPEEGKKIAGVCAGVARYFGVDVSLVRILWVLLSFWPPGAGIVAYFVCWIVMPRDPLPVMAAGQTAPAAGAGPV